MNKIKDNPKALILILTIALFSLSYFVSIATIIIQTLNFLILMEIIRTIIDYIQRPEHRVKLRYIIDGAILFGIRELFVGWIMLKSTTHVLLFGINLPSAVIGIIIMIISLITIGILIFYRVKAMQSSPDYLEKCNDCKNN